MKAAICTKYGPPETLEIDQVANPVPKDDEILVKIISTAVNSADVRVRGMAVSGILRLLMKFVLGFTKPRKPILGTVYSGIVIGMGLKVHKFNLGDRVCGLTGYDFGAYGEYVTVKENSVVSKMPEKLSFDEAASLIFGGQTAIYFLDKLKIAERKQPKVLIIGATGSVGTAAIQLATYYGGLVYAVCGSDGRALMEYLGVSNIIYYDKEDFTKLDMKFDIIFDAFGKTKRNRCKHLLEKGGVYKTVGGLEYASESVDQLRLIMRLWKKGVYKAIIDKVYALEDIVEAHRYVESGRKKGNVVLSIGDNPDSPINFDQEIQKISVG
ncbi:NADPH:quinone reductase [Marivirga sericea]|uniref:NADPH:quinone reductase n=1 Tax=Marivirga sericea TaxID=1028 RepID=A0A1X7K602_9BACT|nr:NAD(P)-dependent alcohol dehydrogenase [Marivirga sericea]SMG36082.1 NADPH:quinone reductase [Marivirga sericea]